MSESSNFSANQPQSERGNDTPLEFPDWSGQLPSRPKMSKDDWLAYCRSNLAKLRARPGHEQIRRQNGISMEFTL